MKAFRQTVITLFVFLPGSCLQAQDIRVGVASNFRVAARAIADDFERSHSFRVILIPGSTGKLYAQIVNGAPVDVFLAADAKRPEMLEQANRIVPGSRFSYVYGRLALWHRNPGRLIMNSNTLTHADFRFLAIANPVLAPYGEAARQVLANTGHWEGVQGRLVMGENVGQVYQFIATGNADLGFVALAQLRQPGRTVSEASFWLVPETLHSRIDQQAVLIRETEGGQAFLAYMQSQQAKGIIQAHGYSTP